MGAIQNSINQIAASAATAAHMIGKEKEGAIKGYEAAIDKDNSAQLAYASAQNDQKLAANDVTAAQDKLIPAQIQEDADTEGKGYDAVYAEQNKAQYEKGLAVEKFDAEKRHRGANGKFLSKKDAAAKREGLVKDLEMAKRALQTTAEKQIARNQLRFNLEEAKTRLVDADNRVAITQAKALDTKDELKSTSKKAAMWGHKGAQIVSERVGGSK